MLKFPSALLLTALLVSCSSSNDEMACWVKRDALNREIQSIHAMSPTEIELIFEKDVEVRGGCFPSRRNPDLFKEAEVFDASVLDQRNPPAGECLGGKWSWSNEEEIKAELIQDIYVQMPEC